MCSSDLTVSDIERVGDHADNIAELAQSLIEKDLTFSKTAINELKEITETAIKCFELSLQAYEFGDKAIAKNALPLEENVDAMEAKLRSRHMKRLAANTCDSLAGIVFLDTISNIERISDHAANIAQTILDEIKSLSAEDMTIHPIA